MSLQPGSKRLLPWVADLRITASSADASLPTGNCRLLPLPGRHKTAEAIFHGDFLSHPHGSFGETKMVFWNVKGG